MESPDFYLTLPSNASMNTHPDNTLTRYITTLPQRLNLSGQWECGLVEILYPHSWYNVREEDAWFGIGLRNTRIEAGYYQGPKTLVKTINKSLVRALPANVVRLSYSVITHKMTLTMLSNVVFLVLPPHGVCLIEASEVDNHSTGGADRFRAFLFIEMTAV